MSDATERLLVRIDATTEQLRRELKRADDAVEKSSRGISSKLKKIGESFKNVSVQAAKIGAAIGAAGVALAFRKITDATAEQQRVTAQLNAVLASTGGIAGKTAKELIDTAGGLQKITTYGDEAIIGMQSLLLTFKEIRGDNFDRTTKAVLDMSTAMGQDLKSSAIQLGKALNDPVTGLSALSRVGITFSESQKEIIKGLAETGRTAEAQILILEELESQFGGSAEAARNTLGGALAGLENAWGDLFEVQDGAVSGMVGSINDLEDAISDPELKQSIQDLSAGILGFATSAIGAFQDAAAAAKFFGEEIARIRVGIAADDIAALEGDIAKIEEMLKGGSVGAFGERFRFFGPDGIFEYLDDNELKAKLAALQTALAAARQAQEDLAASGRDAAKQESSLAEAAEETGGAMEGLVPVTQEYLKALKEIEKAQKKAVKQHEKNVKSFEDSHEELDGMIKAGQEYIEQQEYELSLLGMTAREQAVANAVREAGTRITEEQAQAIRENAAALYDASEASRQAEQASAQMTQAWASARDTLSGFFFEFARDGKNAFDTLVDGFKAMIAKMIAEAAANQIILGIGTAAAGLGFSGAASAATSLVGSGASSAFPLLSGGLTDWFTQNSSFFTNQGLQNAVPGDGGAALGPQFSWANAGLNIGGGLAGGFLANQVFGPSSGMGAALGGLAGSALIPIPGLGTAVGSFVGGALESVFGGKNNGDNKGRADINLAAGTADVYGVGKSFNQANVDAAGKMAQYLQQIAEALGGSDAILNVAVGNRSGLSLNGEKFGKDEAGFIAAAIEAMLDGATGLSKDLKKLIQGFEGASEELVAFATSLVSINELIQDNPAARAAEEFAQSQEIAAMGAMGVYKEQLRALDELIYGFDGSAEAAVTLSAALAKNKELAYEMAYAIEQIGQSVTKSAQDDQAYFRAQTRSPDENLQWMQSQLEYLTGILPFVTDPQQVQDIANRALDFNRQIFDAGPSDLQASNVQTYIDAADFIRAMAQTALNNSQDTLVQTQDNMNAQIGAMLSVAAQGFQAPADTMYSAAQLMYLAVQDFVNNNRYSQVVA